VGVIADFISRSTTFADIPDSVGAGPQLMISVDVTTAGAHDVAALGIPPGIGPRVTIWGGGGGGEGGDGVDGSGAGAGAGITVDVPADLWAMGGSLVIGTGGAGGTPGNPGDDGVDSTLTLNAILRATAGGGGGGPSGGGSFGAGGVPLAGAGITTVAQANGRDGGVATGTHGGRGGNAPLGGGAGGAGGINGGANAGNGAQGGGGGGGSNEDATSGGNGALGKATISYTP
jgi:hypothetical protein